MTWPCTLDPCTVGFLSLETPYQLVNTLELFNNTKHMQSQNINRSDHYNIYNTKTINTHTYDINEYPYVCISLTDLIFEC